MNKENLKRLKKDLEKNCISLTKFLINYCGIYHKDIHDMKISHQDVKELMPGLKRVSFESLLENKDSFYIGDIIPVRDSYGNIVPYENPMLEFDDTLNIDCDIEEKNDELENITISDNLNKHELVNLCRYFKKHNMKKEYRKAYKLLKEEKRNKVKQYKREKIDLRKGMKLYEEY